MSKRNEMIAKLQSGLKKLAEQLNKRPDEVTKAEYMNSSGALSDWELRKNGGFSSLQEMLFPFEADAVSEAMVNNTRNFRKKLTAKYGDKAFKAEAILSTVKEALEKQPIRVHPPVKKSPGNKTFERVIVAHLSDTHYGANINRVEIGGVNHYNWLIAGRRTALFAEQIASYKPQYRKQTKLVLVINGDIIAGMIHDQEWFADLLATQISGSLSILSQMISYLSNQFQSVEVVCNTGNHGRSMHKSSKDRSMTNKWDSYETILFVALKEVIEGKFKNAKVTIPVSPYGVIDVLGHKIFTTHGDTVINVGNPGKNLNMNSISNQINKLNAGLGKMEKAEAKVVMVGHVHTPTVQLMDNGVFVVINGCLSGLDPYANAIGIFDSHPTQQLFEATREHPVGDMRFIQVKNADENEALDKIIKPFDKLF